MTPLWESDYRISTLGKSPNWCFLAVVAKIVASLTVDPDWSKGGALPPEPVFCVFLQIFCSWFRLVKGFFFPQTVVSDCFLGSFPRDNNPVWSKGGAILPSWIFNNPFSVVFLCWMYGNRFAAFTVYPGWSRGRFFPRDRWFLRFFAIFRTFAVDPDCSRGVFSLTWRFSHFLQLIQTGQRTFFPQTSGFRQFFGHFPVVAITQSGQR